MGGDEFIIFLAGTDNVENEKRIAKLLEDVRYTYCENNICMDIHCSAGVMFVNNTNMTFENLYQRVDSALYEAKKDGRNTYKISY